MECPCLPNATEALRFCSPREVGFFEDALATFPHTFLLASTAFLYPFVSSPPPAKR